MGTSLLSVKRKELQIQKGENKAEPRVVEMELEVVNLWVLIHKNTEINTNVHVCIYMYIHTYT